MRLLILYHTPIYTKDNRVWIKEGAFGRYIESLSPYFDKITLFCPLEKEENGPKYEIKAKNIETLPMPSFNNLQSFYLQFFRFLSQLIINIRKVDIVNIRMPTYGELTVFLVSKLFHKPVFTLIVGNPKGESESVKYSGIKGLIFKAYVLLEELFMALITKYVYFNFANGQELYKKYYKDGVKILETKTSTNWMRDIIERDDTCKNKEIKLLCVSRISPRKGLCQLPFVVSQLRNKGYNVVLNIIGPEVGNIGREESSMIKKNAETFGILEKINMLGYRTLEELSVYYQKSDIFILPTLPGEGIPRVLLEAMAKGLPVITTKVAGIPSLIKDRMNGILVATNDSIGLVHAIKEVIDDATLRKTLIRNGLQTAKKYTLENQAKEMMSIILDGLRSLESTLMRKKSMPGM